MVYNRNCSSKKKEFVYECFSPFTCTTYKNNNFYWHMHTKQCVKETENNTKHLQWEWNFMKRLKRFGVFLIKWVKSYNSWEIINYHLQYLWIIWIFRILCVSNYVYNNLQIQIEGY